MGQTLVNIRMDEDLKKSMESTCRELGLNMTTAFTIFARKVSREKRIPFDVSVDTFYGKHNMNALDESVEQLRNGKIVSFSIEELESMETMTPEEASAFVDKIKTRGLLV
ncbi:MAG: type II toxin-antitoxin system RelB/DinJ family antitoxin [Synergistaceae bacterium]|jgi:DNA-damage-inducible protein J|nr:type II toxin-antitoxin system RelB/DinJ family antitoxin [Synergistaceae bacterium]